MSQQFDYDLFVIGAGSGGVRAARMAASKGKRVAVAEERYLGGTCVNVGCVPKKLFVYASQFPEHFQSSRGFGWSHAAQATFDWAALRDNKTTEIERLNGIYQSLIDSSGADLFDGRATVLGPNSVAVNGITYSAKIILIATGGWPFIPEFPGSEYAISSNEMFFLDELPATAVVVGGGYIAVEFAGILNGLGVDTHLVYRGANLLKSFDREMSEKITAGMQEKGVKIHLNTQITSLEKEAGVFNVFCQPEFSTVGLSEEAANKTYADISVYTSDFKPMLQTLGGGNDRISMKLIVDKASDKVVGCHMVGEHAAEIIQGIGIAIKAGATKADFDATVGIHPSAAEEFVTMREPSR